VPLYDYQCRSCGKVTEVRHGFDETYTEKCAQCGGPMARKFSAAPIVFKGSGFYVTDSRKGESTTSTSSSSGSDSKPASSESKPAGGESSSGSGKTETAA
jgi:putative FmdB family regulatory protein